VTGYTLGGGLGWPARRYGLAANSVTAAEATIAAWQEESKARSAQPSGPAMS
jgi:hypothetical protein